jgi:2-polyprenyl-3-methyl-5-hydroxy-6-metoxy-1,4-benzoquinol methylase
MALTEHEIFPDNLLHDQEAAFARDIARLLERRGEFVRVSCPACGRDEADDVFVKFELQYVKCRECRTMYINPRPSPEVLRWYYETSENYVYWNKHVFPASEEARRAKILRPRAERLKALCEREHVGRGTLVEVGAGFGTFCEEVKILGYFERVIAIEPTPDLAATCRRKGLEVIDKPVEEVTLESGAVDAIASFETIEHLFSPEVFLAACSNMLKDNGVLVLSCPNGEGFEVEVLGQASDSVDVEHLNYFNPQSLPRLLERSGFTVLEVLTPGELDAERVRIKIEQGAFDLSSQPFLQRVIVDDWDRLGEPFQRFLSANMLSSHMWVMARKGRSAS